MEKQKQRFLSHLSGKLRLVMVGISMNNRIAILITFDNHSHTMMGKRTGTKCDECSEFLFRLIDLFLFIFLYPLLLSILLKLTSCATTQNNSKYATISFNNIDDLMKNAWSKNSRSTQF